MARRSSTAPHTVAGSVAWAIEETGVWKALQQCVCMGI